MNGSNDLWAARHQATVVNHNPRSLETIVGRHASRLVDLVEEKADSKKAEIIADIGALATMWADVLLNDDQRRRRTEEPLQFGTDAYIDFEFRKLVQQMVMDFTKDAIALVSVPNADPIDVKTYNPARIYLVISQKSGRHFEHIRTHLKEYASFLYRLGRETSGTENFKLIAASCIWSGIHLGTFLDKIL